MSLKLIRICNGAVRRADRNGAFRLADRNRAVRRADRNGAVRRADRNGAVRRAESLSRLAACRYDGKAFLKRRHLKRSFIHLFSYIFYRCARKTEKVLGDLAVCRLPNSGRGQCPIISDNS
jgi:hypothetical protein